MKTLDEIGIACETDRATVFTRTYAHPHGYCTHYDRLFTPLRGKPIKFLEVGVGGGEGVRMWLEYFPNTQVFGVDIVAGTNPWNTEGANPDTRYTFVAGDQSCDTFWKQFVAKYGGNWHVLIDDGGHASNQIITTWREMWPHVVPGGYYCIEDLNTAYSNLPMFVTPSWQNHMDFVKDKLDDMNLGRNSIASLHYSRELAIFRKA